MDTATPISFRLDCRRAVFEVPKGSSRSGCKVARRLCQVLTNDEPRAIRLFLRRRDRNFAEQDVSLLTTLQVDRAGQAFMTIERAACNPWNLLFIDYGLTILHDRNGAAHERDVKGLPLVGLARQLRCGFEESVNSAGVVAGRLLHRLGFYLHFIAAAQINSAVRVLPDVEFDVQLEIFELGIIDQLGTVSRADQQSIFHFPCWCRVGFVLSPSGQIFAVEQLNGLSPFRSASTFELRSSHATP